MVVPRRAGRGFDPASRRFPGKAEGPSSHVEALPELALYAPLVARADPGARHSYKALDPATRIPVEIELVDSRGATRSQRRQMSKRARQLIELSVHPHICRVRSVLELADGRLGVVVAYRPWSLADVVSHGGPVTPAQAAHVGLSVASALAALESAGLSHLALCPENILLAPSGNVEIAGFARLLAGGSRLPPLSEGPQLVRHAAPEVLEGFAAGPPADVYSLGSVIYKMLSGHAAFEVLPGESPAAFALRVLAEPARPLRSGIPDDLRELVGSWLAKNPSARPSSATECVAAWDELRKSNGWRSVGLRVPTTHDGPVDGGREAENTARGVQTAAVPGAESSDGSDKAPSAEDRSSDGHPRLRGSRRAVERPLADAPRAERLPTGLRGQPQPPLKAPDEPLDPLEPLKAPKPALPENPENLEIPENPETPESPGQADGISQVVGDSAGFPAPATRHLGVGARWGRASPARRTPTGASLANVTGRAPARDRLELRAPRQRTAGVGYRGDASRPSRLPLVAKGLIVVAAMVIAVAALVVLGVL